MRTCEHVTGIDLSEYVLFAEYPVIPRHEQPLFHEDFEAYYPMPPRNPEANFLGVIREAQAVAIGHYTNTEVTRRLGRASSDAIKICEQATGIDMQEYMLSAEYPVGPRCSNPVFSNNFEAYSAMPPSDRETNFVRVIREAQETAAQHYGNTELASILRRQSRMRLIRINISHRDASS
ncbi:hypothetical protein LPJ53_005595 [Coemansia erecta]|uniref:Uncharacterized protein n=1 Tax=Coemansia erecta TaxID=147472 RepID=A0A9W7XWI3_9FUNG|nr:hypothetical protein LPJ53_005595 [Coemansia erecta]